MDLHTRMAIAAIISGMRKAGVIEPKTIGAIATELELAIEALEFSDSAKIEQMDLLLRDIQMGTVTRRFPD